MEIPPSVTPHLAELRQRIVSLKLDVRALRTKSPELAREKHAEMVAMMNDFAVLSERDAEAAAAAEVRDSDSEDDEEYGATSGTAFGARAPAHARGLRSGPLHHTDVSTATCRDALRQSQLCLAWNLLSFCLAGAQLVCVTLRPRKALESPYFFAIDVLLVLTLAVDLGVECRAQGARAFLCCNGETHCSRVLNCTQCFGVTIAMACGPALVLAPRLLNTVSGGEVQDDKIVVLSLLLLALRCGFYLVLFGLAQVRGFQLQGGMNSAGEWDIVFDPDGESGGGGGGGGGTPPRRASGGGGLSSSARWSGRKGGGGYGAIATHER